MIESAGGASERTLSRADRRFLLACLAVAALTFAIGVALFPRVNPEASIRFKVSRAESERQALEFLRQVGLDVGAAEHASGFVYDAKAKVFLERSLGVAASNSLMSGERSEAPVRMWRWGHRWFRPLQKDETFVEVTTLGEIAGFRHEIEEEAAAPSLAQDAARDRAERFLVETLHLELDRLELLDARTERRPNRTDHTFIWKRRGTDWRGGTYRHEVRVQGDQIGAYREYVKVPESWERDYQSLRSKNETAASVASGFLFLTIVAAIVVLMIRTRWGDVRWRTAATFGLIGAVLAVLAALNSLPVRLFDSYDTTESLPGFWLTRVLLALAQGMLIGLLIAILAGSGESLYREAYPEKMSLTRFFSLRGLRTRRFLLTTVLGVTMTCFFFCYQEVFYAVALSLGAWAPMEVPYDDLLNTTFPWIFILLVGFLPSVTEEFMSRMFSIPFVKRATGRTWLALLLPAFIWGFAHSNYPNQPFYVRGLEVGLAGILVGGVMLRVNIGATLIWHYMVDALYSSILLFRSGNAYYVLSAALACGVLLIPVVYALWSYRRRGGFEEPDGLLNADEGRAVVPPSVPRAEPMPALPAAWPARQRWLAVGAAALALLLLLLPTPSRHEATTLLLGRGEAQRAADLALRTLGEDPDSFRVALLGEDAFDEDEARYVMQQAGADRVLAEAERYRSFFRWRARYFRPLSAHEVELALDPASGEVVAFERRIAEADSLPSLDSGGAEVLARTFLSQVGIDAAAFDLQESSVENRPHRLDHEFLWESRDDDPSNIGEARHRVRVLVQGDRVAAFERGLKIPEHWERDRDEKTAWWALRAFLMIIAAGGPLGILLSILVSAVRAGETRWGRAAATAVPFGLLALLAAFNNWPQLSMKYETVFPWNVYLVTLLVGTALGAIVTFLLATLAVATITTLYPNTWALRNGRYVRSLLPSALVGAIVSVALVAALDHLQRHWGLVWPKVADPPGPSGLTGLRTLVPWYEVLSRVLRATLFDAALLAGAVGLLRYRKTNRAWTLLFLALAIFALVPISRQGMGEYGLGVLSSVLELGLLLALVRFVLRDNPLAYLLAIYLSLGLREILPYLLAEGTYFRTQGWVALAGWAAPLLWLFFRGNGGGSLAGERRSVRT